MFLELLKGAPGGAHTAHMPPPVPMNTLPIYNLYISVQPPGLLVEPNPTCHTVYIATKSSKVTDVNLTDGASIDSASLYAQHKWPWLKCYNHQDTFTCDAALSSTSSTTLLPQPQEISTRDSHWGISSGSRLTQLTT